MPGWGRQPAGLSHRPLSATLSALVRAQERQPMRPGLGCCSSARACVIGSPQPQPGRARPAETQSSPRQLRDGRVLLSARRVPGAGSGSGGAFAAGAPGQRGWRRARSALSSLGRAMKVEFAPLNIPLARRLQTAAVLQWVLSFLLLGKGPARSWQRKIQPNTAGQTAPSPASRAVLVQGRAWTFGPCLPCKPGQAGQTESSELT